MALFFSACRRRRSRGCGCHYNRGSQVLRFDLWNQQNSWKNLSFAGKHQILWAESMSVYSTLYYDFRETNTCTWTAMMQKKESKGEKGVYYWMTCFRRIALRAGRHWWSARSRHQKGSVLAGNAAGGMILSFCRTAAVSKTEDDGYEIMSLHGAEEASNGV